LERIASDSSSGKRPSSQSAYITISDAQIRRPAMSFMKAASVPAAVVGGGGTMNTPAIRALFQCVFPGTAIGERNTTAVAIRPADRLLFIGACSVVSEAPRYQHLVCSSAHHLDGRASLRSKSSETSSLPVSLTCSICRARPCATYKV